MAAPIEHFAAEIDADGGVVIPSADPLTGGRESTAEILTDPLGLPISQAFPDLVDKVDFALDVLNRELIKLMTVRGLR